MFVSPYSAAQDYEVQEYNQRHRAYLAAEKKRKQEEKLIRQASNMASGRAAGYEKGGRGLLKRLLSNIRRQEAQDKEGASRLNEKDDGADGKTLVDETDWESDQVSIKTALA